MPLKIKVWPTLRTASLEIENRRLKIERDILKKATAFFVKEGGQP